MTTTTYDSNDPAGQETALEIGRRMLARQLPSVQLDNRFEAEPERVAELAIDGAPAGVATLSLTDRSPGETLPLWSVQMIVEDASALCPLVEAVLPPEGAELWIRPENHDLVSEIRRCWPPSFPRRRLHLMAIDLPISTEPLPTRALDPKCDDDVAALLRINNAAFASHPDQGRMTEEDVRSKLAAPGHSPEGVRLAEIDGELQGFCWTQVHRARQLGEISVIGLHPDVHGRGMGGPMTAAGLVWMHEQGLDRAILYVEADNRSAVRSYIRLGFQIVSDDVSWIVPGGEPNQ
jgi:ribosomal protein S18 acetylase RimI-like enzyme